jgi:hypothetical protein
MPIVVTAGIAGGMLNMGPKSAESVMPKTHRAIKFRAVCSIGFTMILLNIVNFIKPFFALFEKNAFKDWWSNPITGRGAP